MKKSKKPILGLPSLDQQVVECAAGALGVVIRRFDHTASIVRHKKTIVENVCKHFGVDVPASLRGLGKIRNTRDLQPWLAKKLIPPRREISVAEICQAAEEAVRKLEGEHGLRGDWFREIEGIAKRLLRNLNVDYQARQL